jgi:hypothetical protein
MNYEEHHFGKVKESIENIIKANTSVKRKKKTKEDIDRLLFNRIVNNMITLEGRTVVATNELGLNFSQYDESFYNIIDDLIQLYFGNQAAELVYFYIYERINPDGSINELTDKDNNIISLNSINDLWDLVSNVIKTTK